MRYRATIFLLLAGLFAIVPFVQWREQQAQCMARTGPPAQGNGGLFDTGIGGPPDCPYLTPPTPSVRALGILSVLCGGAFLFFLVQGVAARRREQALLRAAGVNVPEDDLPIEE